MCSDVSLSKVIPDAVCKVELGWDGRSGRISGDEQGWCNSPGKREWCLDQGMGGGGAFRSCLEVEGMEELRMPSGV